MGSSRLGAIAVSLLVAAATRSMAQSAQISLRTQALQSDGTVVVPFSFPPEGQQIAAIQFDITFDSTVTTLAPSVGSSAAGASKTVNDVTSTVLRVVLSGINQNSIPDGTLVSLVITPFLPASRGLCIFRTALRASRAARG